MSNPENSENEGLKVNDRRRFAPDGTPLTENQENEKSEPLGEPPIAQSSEPAEYPADFASMLLSLAASAQTALGIAPNHLSGKIEKNLQQAKYSIDLLGLLQEKTRGNLTKEEEKLLEVLLYDLRLQYVEASTKN